MISPSSTNPMLTELGRANVFRVIDRDDANGIVVGNYLADHWRDKKIAILHDDTVFGKGIAEVTKKQLNRRGLTEAIYQAYVPGKNDYGAEIDAASGGRYRRGVHWRIPHRDRAHGTCGTRPRLPGSAGSWSQPGDRGFWPHCRPRGRRNALHSTTPIRADAPKQRRSSSGSERQVSSRRVTPCTLMPPFRCGRRRPRKPARWSSRR